MAEHDEKSEDELAAFQDEVLREIKLLNAMIDMNRGFRSSPSKGSEKGPLLNQLFETWVSVSLGQYTLGNLKKQKRVDEYTAQAREFLKDPETKELLCSRLRAVDESLSRLTVRSIEQDAAEIASAITPLLYPRAQSKSISLPDSPVAFALSAWILARTGIKSYCPSPEEAEPLNL